MTEVNEAPNWLLLDDDDELVTTAADSTASKDLLFAPEEQPVRVAPAKKATTNPYAPVRTDEEQAEVDRKKAAGEVSDGRKKNVANPVYRRKVLTARDYMLLGSLAKHRVGTAKILSQLLIVDNPHLANHGKLLQPQSVTHRLRGLQEAGLVECRTLLGPDTIWALTNKGITAAEMAFNFREEEIHTTKNFKNTQAAHALAVHNIAAQAMSPNAYRWRRALGIKEPLSVNQLLTEHEVMHHWAQRKKQLAEEYTEVDAERKPTFGYWRANMIRDAGANLRDGLMDWEMLAEWHPEIWTIGVLKSIGDSDVRDHHHPDLVLNLEDTRKGNRPASIAIEVELTAKNVDTYAKHLATWYQCELENGERTTHADGAVTTGPALWQRQPTIYARLVYFTNNQAAIRNLRVADKQFGLEEAKRLVILPLLDRDDKTPLRLTEGWSAN